MSSMRLHDPVRVRSTLHELRDVLTTPLPSFYHEKLEFLAFCRSLHALLHREIATCRNTVQWDATLRELRSKLTTLLVDDAELLNRVDETVASWTNAMLVWIVVCQLNMVIHRLHHDSAPDALGPLQLFAASDHPFLTRQRVCMFDKPVLDYSMSEFLLALNALRARIDVLTGFDGSLVRYMIALQCRASVFIASAGKADTFDVDEWCCKPAPNGLVTCHRNFVQYTLWAFVWLNRYVNNYTRLVPKLIGVHIRATPAHWHTTMRAVRERLDAFVTAYTASMKTDEYARNFKKRAYDYEAWPGEREACTYRYGGNTETSTINDIMNTQRPSEAGEHLFRVKFRQPMSAWFEPLAPTGDRYRLMQQFAFLHVINSFLQGRLGANFLDWCVCVVGSQRRNRDDFLSRTETGVRLGKPFLVQRLGNYAVCVPRFSEARFDRIFAADESRHSALQLTSSSVSQQRRGALFDRMFSDDDNSSTQSTANAGDDDTVVALIDCTDVFEAFVVWAVAVLALENGMLHGRVSIRPFLRSIVFGDDRDAGDAVEQVDADLQLGTVAGDI